MTRDHVERRVFATLKVLTIIGLVIVTAGPLLYMMLLSIRPLQAIMVEPLDVVPSPSEFTLSAFQQALASPADGGYGMSGMVGNTLFVAVGTVGLALAFSVLGAYAAVRLRFFGKRTINASFFAIYMFPNIVLAIPLFVLFSRLGLRGELSGLVIIYMASTVPVALYMLRNYFGSVPPSLEEAAAVDGASRVQTIKRIVLPLAMPGIAATGFYIFMIVWNEYLFARLFMLESRDAWTVSLGLAQLDDINVAPTILMAGSVLLTVPVVVLFFFVERLLVEGLTAGAEKG